MHNHQGIFSFVVWLKIPFEVEDQKLLYLTNGIAFCGGFSYSDTLGSAVGWSSIINNNKRHARHFISYGYLTMGVVQYFILLFFEYKNLDFSKIYYVFLVFLLYLPSQIIFKKVNNFLFRKVISGIALLYGLIILITNFYIY